ncbi:MAG: hypothetical protein JWM95_410 [Gemmatimonadetes bacterium]|nr:hypothetical protein [Gemmatimonadota bacterium]
MVRRFLFVIGLACFSNASVAAAQAQADVRAARVDSLFRKYDAQPSPGLALAVIKDGRVVLRRGYGLANLEHGIRITPETIFDVASLSKQFTGLAIAMLVTEGRVKLSDDVRKYIPELPLLPQPITIEHLVHHTSGVRDWPGALSIGGWRYDDVITFQQTLGVAYRAQSLNFQPGAEHLYSNTGYNLLAEVVTRVTGQSLAQWTQAQLFGPLGMTRSHFRTDFREVIANRASGYAQGRDGAWRTITDNLSAPGSSSLFSTADDLARWLINYGSLAVGGSAAHQLMRTPGRLNDGSVVPYAFGILTGSYRGMPMITHSGAWASFATYTVYMPEQRLGIAVLANSDAIDAQRGVIDIANIYLDTATSHSSPNASPAEPAAASPDTAQRPNTPAPTKLTALAEFVAGYESTELGTTYDVTMRGDTLALVHTRLGRIPLTRITQDAFTSETWFLRSIRFDRDPSGSIVGFVVNGDARNRDIRFARRR